MYIHIYIYIAYCLLCIEVLSYLVPSTWYASICICVHPYALIGIRHASVYTHMPPYASSTYHNVNIHKPFLNK